MSHFCIAISLLFLLSHVLSYQDIVVIDQATSQITRITQPFSFDHSDIDIFGNTDVRFTSLTATFSRAFFIEYDANGNGTTRRLREAFLTSPDFQEGTIVKEPIIVSDSLADGISTGYGRLIYYIADGVLQSYDCFYALRRQIKTGMPNSPLLHHQRGLMYYLDSQTVRRFNMETLEDLELFTLNNTPTGLSASRSYLYVAHSDMLSLYDLNSGVLTHFGEDILPHKVKFVTVDYSDTIPIYVYFASGSNVTRTEEGHLTTNPEFYRLYDNRFVDIVGISILEDSHASRGAVTLRAITYCVAWLLVVCGVTMQ